MAEHASKCLMELSQNFMDLVGMDPYDVEHCFGTRNINRTKKGNS